MDDLNLYNESNEFERSPTPIDCIDAIWEEQAGASSAGILMDLAASEKDVHSDFYNGM